MSEAEVAEWVGYYNGLKRALLIHERVLKGKTKPTRDELEGPANAMRAEMRRVEMRIPDGRLVEWHRRAI